MPHEMFLDLDGVDGDVTVKGFEKWIGIQSFAWGVENAGAGSSGGGAGSGKAVPSELSLVKATDAASAHLLDQTLRGLHTPTARLHVRGPAPSGKGSGLVVLFLKVELQEVVVTSWRVVGDASSTSPRSQEQVTLGFERLSLTSFDRQGDPTTVNWDFAKNSSF